MRKMFVAPLFVILPSLCLGASADPAVGRVVLSEGEVEAVDASGSARELLRGGVVMSSETIRTAGSARVQVRMTDGGLISLKEGSELEVVLFDFDGPGGSADRAEYYLHAGGIRTITGQIGEDGPDVYVLKSDYGELRIRGTTYECRIAGALYCGVYDGAISLRNAGVTLDLGLGTSVDFATVSSPSEPPVPLLQQPPQLAFP